MLRISASALMTTAAVALMGVLAYSESLPPNARLTTIAIAAIVVSIIGFVTYNAFIYPTFLSPLRHLHGPKPSLIGHFHLEATATTAGEPYISWMRQWPEAQMIRFSNFGNQDALIITGIYAWKAIMAADGTKLQKPNWYKRLTMALLRGKGILSISGNEHKQLRKQLNPAFSYQKLAKMIPVILEKARAYTTHLEDIIATRNGMIECSEYYSRITLDIVGLLTTGVDLLNMSKSKDNVIHDAYISVFVPEKASQLLLLMIDTMVPIRWLPLAENKRFKESFTAVENRVYSIAQERRRQIHKELKGEDDTSREWPDVLTNIMRDAEIAGQPFEDHDIMGHLVTLLAAGHETTATCMLWATYELTQSTEIQDKLRKEILDLLAVHPEPTFKEIDALPYMDALFREVLRLHAMAISTPREASTDLEVCGTVIPKGTPIIIMPLAPNRNPTIWGPTVDKFDPERWMGPDRQNLLSHFISFYGGPRSCIGRMVAMMEMKIIMMEMISKFRVSLPGEVNLEMVPMSITNRPKNGMHIKVEKL